MATGSRIRHRLDVGRLREAAAGPGADPRSWVAFGRVDDDDDAVRWETDLGWIADVTIVGGQLDGEGPVACRIAGSFVAPGEGGSAPVVAGALLVLALPEGDLNAGPIAIGALWTPDVAPPTKVGGKDVNEAFNDETWWVSVARNITIEARDTRELRALGNSVLLADPDAAESFVKGNAQLTALKDVLTALDAYAQALAVGTPANPVLISVAKSAQTTLTIAIETAKTSLEEALSTRIKGV